MGKTAAAMTPQEFYEMDRQVADGDWAATGLVRHDALYGTTRAAKVVEYAHDLVVRLQLQTELNVLIDTFDSEGDQ